MSIYTGRQIHFWIWIEQTRWTQAANAMWVPKTSMDFDDKIEITENTSSIWNKIDVSWLELTKQWWEGSVETVASANSIWNFLLCALWKDTVSTIDAGLNEYAHTFTIENSEPNPSATIFTKEPNWDFYYPLALISDFTLSAAVGEDITASASYMSKKAVATSLNPTYNEDFTFTTKNATIKIAETVAELDTAPLACIESIELQITKENIEQYCLNYGNEPKDIVDWKISISGSLVATFSNNDYKNLALDWKQFAMKIELEDESGFAKVWFYPSITITIPKAKFNDYWRDKWNDDIVKVNLSYKAFQNDSQNEAIEVVLVNNTPTYIS